MAGTTTYFGLQKLDVGQPGASAIRNHSINILDSLGAGLIASRTTSASPGSPIDGDMYYIPLTPSSSGDWTGQEGKVAIYFTKWFFFATPIGFTGWIIDETDKYGFWNGSVWKDVDFV